MCGFIAGLWNQGPAPEHLMLKGLDRMARRGPDGVGQWSDRDAWLGHRRLSIIDLDPRAAQPFHSGCGRYSIVFNGEIYNYQELRDELARSGVAFKTTSDTEVVLELFAKEGPEMLPRLRGMFAFLIWDRASRKAFVARDPYGIKPLYYATTSSGTLVGSQVTALLATGLPSREPSARGQATFWMLGHVAEPFTWYRDIHALPAGNYMWIRGGQASAPIRWFDVADVWRGSEASSPPGADVEEEVRAALHESTRAHLVADVPVGLFLSGGIDSGALAGLIAQHASSATHAVTLSFGEFAGSIQDEAPAAKILAQYYGLKHQVRHVGESEFRTDLERILGAMDQPSIDGVNTWYAAKAAAEIGLKVVIAGTGGDELFQGYPHFRQIPRLVSAWRRLASVPGASGLARILLDLQARRTGNSRWRYLPAWSASIGGAWWLRRSLYSPADLPGLMGAELAQQALAEFSPDAWVGDMSGPLATDGLLAVGQIESTTYLRNQLLRDSDWASMDHSIELRTPLADAWLLRDCAKLLPQFHRFPGKQLLARAPSRPLPRVIAERKKTGFGIPVARWLQGASATASKGGSRGWALDVAQHYDARWRSG